MLSEDGQIVETSNKVVANLGGVLYTLAVNFLLYVVLIIVFYMVVRFYLEEETETATDISPKKVYVRVPVVEKSEDVSGAIDDDEEEEDGETPDVNATNKKTLLNFEDFVSDSALKTDGHFLSAFKHAISNDWSSEEGTKQEVMQRAIFCSVALNITFCISALLQERMLTYPYDNEYFVNSYGLVFFTRVGGLLLSAYFMYKLEIQWVSSPLHEYSFPSVANMLSSWCQYEALKYISFPTQVLAKSFKLVPVMLMGKFLHNKTYESYEYVTAFFIGFGIYVFLDSSENFELVRDIWNNEAACGVILLILFLFFDSFTSQWQERMFHNKKTSPLQMMLVINAFSAVFSFITLVHGRELSSAVVFLYAHPKMVIHLLFYCLFSMIGQLFIFYTVKQFGAVVFSTMMSIRILFSILLSCLIFSHPIKEMGIVGMMIVFGTIAYRIKRKNDDAPLFQWRVGREMTYQSSKSIFHHWHQHVDI